MLYVLLTASVRVSAVFLPRTLYTEERSHTHINTSLACPTPLLMLGSVLVQNSENSSSYYK